MACYTILCSGAFYSCVRLINEIASGAGCRELTIAVINLHELLHHFGHARIPEASGYLHLPHGKVTNTDHQPPHVHTNRDLENCFFYLKALLTHGS